MNNTQETKTVEQHVVSMTESEYEQDLIASYMAGVVDSIGNFSSSTTKNDEVGIGYHLKVRFTLRRAPDTVENMFSEWLTERGIFHDIHRGVLRVHKKDDLEQLCIILQPFVVETIEDTQLMLEEILPRLRNERHLTEEGLVETMYYTEQLSGKKESKNTRESLITEFGLSGQIDDPE
jgi:hypothetical protein